MFCGPVIRSWAFSAPVLMLRASQGLLSLFFPTPTGGTRQLERAEGGHDSLLPTGRLAGLAVGVALSPGWLGSDRPQ